MIGLIIAWYIEPFIGSLFLGLAYSIALCSIWTGVVFIINKEQHGKAFSALKIIENIIFALVTCIIGLLRWLTKDYFYG